MLKRVAGFVMIVCGAVLAFMPSGEEEPDEENPDESGMSPEQVLDAVDQWGEGIEGRLQRLEAQQESPDPTPEPEEIVSEPGGSEDNGPSSTQPGEEDVSNGSESTTGDSPGSGNHGDGVA